MIKNKISNQFLINYLIMLFITILIIILIQILLSFANDVISKNLACNSINIKELMNDNIEKIPSDKVLENGGGIQIINKDYKVIFSKGLNTLDKSSLTTQEFTDFLTSTNKSGVEYCYNILYNDSKEFWLIVTFPISLRIDFKLSHNDKYDSVDKQAIWSVLIAIGIFFFLLLGITTLIYSKITSFGIIIPLRKLCEGTECLRKGIYSTRVHLNFKNEFGELEYTFNAMAAKIEEEISLRKKAEDMRKKLIMDISHDLKNPLASIIGYSDLALNKRNITLDEQTQYIHVIKDNGMRTNRLIENLFELSKLESTDFKLKLEKVDIAEYLRTTMAKYILVFEDIGFTFNFDILEEEIYVMIDKDGIDRVFQNLISNAIKYNKKGTNINLSLINSDYNICIVFEDNGIGIPKTMQKNIFNAFIRVNDSKSSETAGTGLGLAITKKIINAHGGEILLESDVNSGCAFKIFLPKI